jgi:hypothetical protein
LDLEEATPALDVWDYHSYDTDLVGFVDDNPGLRFDLDLDASSPRDHSRRRWDYHDDEEGYHDVYHSLPENENESGLYIGLRGSAYCTGHYTHYGHVTDHPSHNLHTQTGPQHSAPPQRPQPASELAIKAPIDLGEHLELVTLKEVVLAAVERQV